MRYVALMFFLALHCLLSAACSSGNTSRLSSDPLAVNLADLNWGLPGNGDVAPAGTRTATMGVDSETGGATYYAWFPAGGHFDLHWHSYNEYVAVVQGPLTLNLGGIDYQLQTGAYVVIPGSMPHYWDIPDSGDAIILVRRAGPADFNFMNR